MVCVSMVIQHDRDGTHEVKVNMGVEDVHELTHLLVDMLRALHPLGFGMRVPDKLCEIYYAA